MNFKNIIILLEFIIGLSLVICALFVFPILIQKQSVWYVVSNILTFIAGIVLVLRASRVP